MKTLNGLSKKQKLELKDRIKFRTLRYKSWGHATVHARLMILHARIMMSLPMPYPEWPRVLGEWRKRLKDSRYIMECND